MRFERVVAATDFSEEAKIATSEAVRWCKATAEFEIVHVVPVDETRAGWSVTRENLAAPGRRDRIDQAQRQMNHLLADLPLGRVAHRILVGSVTEEICSEAASYHADLVVVGACRHAPAEHFYLGSRARAILWGNAPKMSVFVGRPPRHPVRGETRVAVATDFGAQARAAAVEAASVLRSPGMQIHLVHVVDTGVWLGETTTLSAAPGHERVGGSVRARKLDALRLENGHAFQGRADEHLLVGDPTAVLVQFAKDQRIDLLILGTSGPHREGPVTLGSVAADVAEKAPCSVLVVRA